MYKVFYILTNQCSSAVEKEVLENYLDMDADTSKKE